MAKFIFTEEQIQITKKILSENQTGMDFKLECDVDVDYYRVNKEYKGGELEGIEAHGTMTMTYSIDMEGRSYGIKSIIPYAPKGPSEIELTIIYQDPNDEDGWKTLEDTITIPLNWDDVEQEESHNISYIGYENLVTIILKSDEQGNIVLDGINLYYHSI